VAQGTGPEFKSQYHKTKQNKTKKGRKEGKIKQKAEPPHLSPGLFLSPSLA
jgi:hypothetical protein